jgi:serine/threonine protein kinase
MPGPALTPQEVLFALPGFAQISPIATRGQGAVFRARHPRYGDCAVKVYSEESASRVEAEVDFLRDVDHPSIISILENGVVNIAGTTYPYTVMPYIHGGTLQLRIDDSRPLSEAETKTLMRGVVGAIAVLWGARKVHRDIKPENILLSLNCEPVLIDFGVVRHLDRTTLTTPGGAPGTSGFKSPEQSSGVRSLSYKSDVFSLGISAYCGMSGLHPFQGRQDLIDLGVRPTSLVAVADCSPPLADLVARMLISRAVMRPSLAELGPMLK